MADIRNISRSELGTNSGITERRPTFALFPERLESAFT
jgi:hypothetical protein